MINQQKKLTAKCRQLANQIRDIRGGYQARAITKNMNCKIKECIFNFPETGETLPVRIISKGIFAPCEESREE